MVATTSAVTARKFACCSMDLHSSLYGLVVEEQATAMFLQLKDCKTASPQTNDVSFPAVD